MVPSALSVVFVAVGVVGAKPRRCSLFRRNHHHAGIQFMIIAPRKQDKSCLQHASKKEAPFLLVVCAGYSLFVRKYNNRLSSLSIRKRYL